MTNKSILALTLGKKVIGEYFVVTIMLSAMPGGDLLLVPSQNFGAILSGSFSLLRIRTILKFVGFLIVLGTGSWLIRVMENGMDKTAANRVFSSKSKGKNSLIKHSVVEWRGLGH